MKKYTEQLVEAVLAGRDVHDAVNQLIAQKERECRDFASGLKVEEQELALLVKALDMPEGSAGRAVADAIADEMRLEYPDAVAHVEAQKAETKRLRAAMLGEEVEK